MSCFLLDNQSLRGDCGLFTVPPVDSTPQCRRGSAVDLHGDMVVGVSFPVVRDAGICGPNLAYKLHVT